MILTTKAYAQESRDAMRECFSEVENIMVAIDKFRLAWSTAFDERLDGREVAELIFDVGTNNAVAFAFSKISQSKDFDVEKLSEDQQLKLLSDIKEFLKIRSATAMRVADIADVMKSTNDPLLIADAKADYVQACIKSIHDGEHFTDWHQLENEEDQIVDHVRPKKSSLPLTGGERDAFRNQVASCWAINVGSRASNIKLTVSMDMHPDGQVVASSIALIGFEGGNHSDANVAFQAARRALLRCQKNGYDLPIDKYEHWRNLEMTFDPNEMRSR